ncbi:MAG: lipoprotein signal peptidase [Bacteroidetes bacterium]|nr:lipoprotein signal peptidase [Bacteroidota bacterium]
MTNRIWIPIGLSSALLLVDQASKIWVKTNMMLGEHFNVAGEWFQIYFIENNGMAFGMELGGEWGKLALTLFRLVAVAGILYIIRGMLKSSATRIGALAALSLILAGAMGNIIDSVFYGPLFGYERWFHGRVVDMLYFPLWQGFLPEWIPFVGGDYFIFFRPVFNVADSAITTGVAMLLVFQRRYFPPDALPASPTETPNTTTPDG